MTVKEPQEFAWDYDRAEIAADGVVHGTGVCFGLVGAAALIHAVTAASGGGLMIWSAAIYAATLLIMLSVSASYNMWPVTPSKWILRRIDHSVIYLLIAGTYTPFLLPFWGRTRSAWLLIAIWLVAIAGIVLKLVLPGRFDRVAVALYVALGWSGVLAYDLFVTLLPDRVLVFLAIGGVLYTAGIVFHLWEALRFQNAIWHGFVLAGAALQYAAVFVFVSARP